MIGSIQMEKPAENSRDYYLSFYNMYNLLQINDAIIFGVFNEAVKAHHLTTQDLLNMANPDNYAIQLCDYFLMIGVSVPETIIEMCKENRGTDVSFANELQKNNRNPFEWFRNINEFVQLYAIFEQAIKEFLGNTRIDEKDVIKKLIACLDDNSQTDTFFDKFNFKTFGLIENADEMKAIWVFYTKIRNCVSHSGGRITKKVIDGFNEIKSRYRQTLDSIEQREYLSDLFLLDTEDNYTLFKCNYLIGDILDLDEYSLNFFRMFCVFSVETLNSLQ